MPDLNRYSDTKWVNRTDIAGRLSTPKGDIFFTGWDLTNRLSDQEKLHLYYKNDPTCRTNDAGVIISDNAKKFVNSLGDESVSHAFMPREHQRVEIKGTANIERVLDLFVRKYGFDKSVADTIISAAKEQFSPLPVTQRSF